LKPSSASWTCRIHSNAILLCIQRLKEEPLYPALRLIYFISRVDRFFCFSKMSEEKTTEVEAATENDNPVTEQAETNKMTPETATDVQPTAEDPNPAAEAGDPPAGDADKDTKAPDAGEETSNETEDEDNKDPPTATTTSTGATPIVSSSKKSRPPYKYDPDKITLRFLFANRDGLTVTIECKPADTVGEVKGALLSVWPEGKLMYSRQNCLGVSIIFVIKQSHCHQQTTKYIHRFA
jgi:hypothetical protein